MRLFEAIIDANHRAIAGDATAGVHIADFENDLPVIALTCVDPRLNALFPNVLGLPDDQFIWLRTAGNIITGPLSSTLRSLALACSVKGGKEIAVIGHTDCQVCKTSTTQLLDRLKGLGIDRHLLPENLNEFFGLFSSERQNVIKGCDIVRHSPLIGPKIPVHGLLADVGTGSLEWIVNGYQNWETLGDRWNEVAKSAGQTVDALKSLAEFKIGETVTQAGDWLGKKIQSMEIKTPAASVPPPTAPPSPITPPGPPPVPPRIPLPPSVRARLKKPWAGK
jgi:carbonic anhydrase